MATAEDTKSQLLELWSIQINIQMWYRSISATTLSILFAGSLLLVSQLNSDPIRFVAFLVLTFLGLISAWRWGKLHWKRGRYVDYLRARLFWAE